MLIKEQFDIPILFILFNRPRLAARTLQRIRAMQPINIYIAIDGVRISHPQDLENVNACRALINEINWPCTVHTLFRDKNLGCKYAVSGAIDWFFEQVEHGIILEDDCLPDPTFFNFCRNLLLKYKDDERVMHIGGANLFPFKNWGQSSYFFTKICHIWGWATWRRAWQHYDVDMKLWSTDNEATFIGSQVNELKSVKYWNYIFKEVFAGKIDTWDYQWVYAIWRNNGLCIIPKYNLITNIGFGENATHTLFSSPFANLSTIAINDIIDPGVIEDDKALTQWLASQLFRLPSFLDILRMKIERRLKL